MMVGCALAVAALGAYAAEPTARVVTFSPQGTVPAVQQVRATFSEPMLPLGKVTAPGPFDVDCALKGDAHWVDDRTWVMDLHDQELNGQACEFRVKAALRSLAGHAVEAQKVFRFQVPVLTDEARRTIRYTQPWERSDRVAEDQAFLVRYSTPLGTTPPDLRCVVPGRPEAQVVRLGAEEREALKKGAYSMAGADGDVEGVRCPFPLPTGGRVTLRLDRGALKAQELTYTVRPAPAVAVDCRRVALEGDCAAGFPVTLQFNAPMPQALLSAVQLQTEAGWQGGEVKVEPANMYASGSSSVTFPEGLFKPSAEYRIRWPQEGMADASGRSLPQERVPASIKTLPVLGLAYFVAPVISVRPLQADSPVPLYLQGAGFDTVVREARFGLGANEREADGDLLRWMGVWRTKVGVSRYFGVGGRSGREYFGPFDPALPDSATVLPLQSLGPAALPTSRNAQVALQGPGLHVLEMRAFAGKSDPAGLKPMYDSVAVLLTRMAVHLKAGEEGGAVWVTRLDNGAPVAGVALKVYDCGDGPAWQGQSDAQGLARIDRKLKLDCERDRGEGVTVVARHTWPDGVRDVSVANTHWGNNLLDANSYHVQPAWGPAPIQAHTVLDRTLFKPGEMVSMRHVLRRETETGLGSLTAGELPNEAQVSHAGSGKEWKVPVTWAALGDGTATFTLPADAPLGQYRVELALPDPDAHNRVSEHMTVRFSVEAFRLPAMLGVISAPTPKLTFGATPTLQLALHYADGGAAQNWPATLTVYAQARRRQAGLDGYASEDDMAQPHNAAPPPAQVQLHTQALELDAQGRAQVVLPALPVRDQPYVLHAELSYQDPSGEAQTLSQDFDVQASLWTAGVRTVGPLVVQRRVEVQGQLVDENGARLAGRRVRLSAARRTGYAAEDVQQLGEVCNGVTDTNGELLCPYAPPQAGAYQFTLTAADAAGRVASGRSRIAAAGEQRLPAQPLFVHAAKPLYRAGEVADLSITSPFPRSRVWLTIERQGILASRVLELDAAQSRIKLPIPREWAGNVAVALLALDASPGARADVMATGITPLIVSTDAHALKVTVKPERTRYQPRDKAMVRIHVASPDGRPLPAQRRVSFVAVDEALLSLKDNPTWQLLAYMQRPRGRNVQTASNLPLNPAVDANVYLMSAQTSLMSRLLRAAELERRREQGMGIARPMAPSPAITAAEASMKLDQQLERVEVTGSRIAQADAAPPPPTRTLLDALLIWQADVPLDDNGDAVVSIPIKDSLSRFRLVAVASAGVEDFGTGSAHLDVVKDLQLTAGLPPQVRDGDRFAALVTVRNTSSAAITLDAAAKLAGQPALPVRTLRLAAGESRQLSWDVRVPLGTKALDWTFSAKEQGHANRQDVLQVAQQVLPAVPVTVQAATLAQVNGTFDVPAFGFDSAEASSARVNVQLLPTLAGNLGGVRDWLALYPYRCLEQTASRAIGMHDRAAWDAAMATLPQYLDADGLANYFPRMPSQPWPGSDTLTAYLLDIAHAAGWPVPEAERNRMLTALEGFVAGRLQRSFWAPRKDDLARKVAAMATLARYARLKPVQLAGVRIDPDEWTTAMLIDWLTLQRKAGGTKEAQAQAENALRARLTYQGRRMGFSTEARDYWWWLMSHGDVDAARLMLTVADLPEWKADLPRLLTGLLSRQNHGAWATTTANAWGTLAVDGFARIMEPVPVAGQTRITLGTQQQTVSWSEPKHEAFDAKLEKPTDALHIQHQGTGAPWASVEVRAAVPLKEPRAAGYSISRSITPVQQRVPGQWHVGDTLRVRLTVRAQADMSWVVVDDPVPAGASLLGNGLGRDSAAAQAGEQRAGWVWPLYQARDYTSFKSFYRYVPRGEFSLEYTVRLNNPGQFALPPTRVEAMYAPEVFGEAPNVVFGVEP